MMYNGVEYPEDLILLGMLTGNITCVVLGVGRGRFSSSHYGGSFWILSGLAMILMHNCSYHSFFYQIPGKYQ